MKLSNSLLRSVALLGVLAAVTACSDDDDNGPNPPTLAAPTGVTATVNGPDIDVTWNAVPNATGYRVERQEGAGAFTAIANNLAATAWTDAAVDTNVVYGYRVYALGDGSTSSSASSVVNASIGGPKVATVTGTINANRTFTSDSLYILSGYVKVASGATLTIQAGTRLEGDTTAFGSSLWILRGAKIDAQGTSANPIVFTSQRTAGNRAPGDWGGVIIVGNGIINRTGVIQTEGPAGVAENYGQGTDNADDSGSLRYARIEFAGFDVSGGGNSELNGLSMYAVGSGTDIEYVQVSSGLDDSFEWWGGAVDSRYLISYEAGDDHFDTSEGHVGRHQFLIGLQTQRLQPAAGTGVLASDPQGFEMDGCAGTGCDGTSPARSEPYADPAFVNVTMVGMGATETTGSGGNGLVIRRGTMAQFRNVIVANWKGSAVSVRDTSQTLWARDSVTIGDIVFADNVANWASPADVDSTKASNAVQAANTAAILPNLGTFNFVPAGAAAAGCGTTPLQAAYTANFFGGAMTIPTYCGGVSPAGTPWYQGWSSFVAN